jgi:amidase
MQADPLVRLTATEAVGLLRRGEIAPIDLIDAAAERIGSIDGQVNALPIRFFDRGRDAARRLDAARARRDARPGWLAGLPIAVKDYNDIAGQPTTYGSPIFAHAIATATDITVATLEANGAIPIVKSNVPEFAGANTFNPIFGATRNPWDLRMSAGGSSGGAAAALASGMIWLAMGSDLGGSLRIPASYCGIVGLRPSVGRVPRGVGLPAFDSLWVEGPMGRTVADVALMLDAQSVQSTHDPLSSPAPQLPFAAATSRPKPPRRVAFTPDLGLGRVDPEVVAICRTAARRFAALGSDVAEAAPDFSGAIDAFQVLRALLFATVRGELLASQRERITADIAWNIEKGLKLAIAEVIAAERNRAALYHRVADFFEDYAILACPTVATPPFPVEQRFPVEIAGEKLTTYIDWMFLTFAVTLTGCPAISIPCGFTRSGLPVGLQLVGRSHGDFDLLSAAHLIEQELRVGTKVPIEPRSCAINDEASGW